MLADVNHSPVERLWLLSTPREEAAMIKISVSRLATAVALSAVLAGVGALPAAARPDDGRGGQPSLPRVIVIKSYGNCPLLRLDRQLVRCDNLTGAGVPAPLFIPEL
jgi:hypothetical protein